MKPPVPERIATLSPYQPGRPIEEVERELGLSGTIKLASNENALGASPAALKAAAAALERVHRYPEGGVVLLRRALAERLGVAEDQLVFGNGSNEIIELAVRVFADGGREVVFSENAFMIYELVARAEGARPVAVPSRNFEHDLEALAAAVHAPGDIAAPPASGSFRLHAMLIAPCSIRTPKGRRNLAFFLQTSGKHIYNFLVHFRSRVNTFFLQCTSHLTVYIYIYIYI